MERSRGKLVEFKKRVLRTVISEIIIDAQSMRPDRQNLLLSSK
jgi:hypothetical protein